MPKHFRDLWTQRAFHSLGSKNGGNLRLARPVYLHISLHESHNLGVRLRL